MDKTMETQHRCQWCGDDPLYITYHDQQWGVPLDDDQQLFEMLTLEGAQAGLSWLTILRKRDNYLQAFDNFDIEKIAAYGQSETERLMADGGIVRNRLKIDSVIMNARGVLTIYEEFTSLSSYLWRYVDGVPLQNGWKALEEIPPYTPLSQAMSKDLKRRGFNFVGPTICYALMQAVGMVNDHTVDCFRYREVERLGKSFRLSADQ